jgi:esterase/lipase
LRDIRARFVPGINAWNQLMKHLKIKRGRLEYIEDLPENIVTNYKRNYLTSIEQLGDLMEECENNLKKVTQNSLLIQAINDPVVNSSGAKIIFKKIKSKNKILKEVDFSNHVIINGDRKEEIFKIISDYLEKKFYN